MPAWRATQILWSPRAGAREAARAGLGIPLLALAVAGGLPDLMLLLEFGTTDLVQRRLSVTPEGMTPLGIVFFLTFTFASPALLPGLAWATGRALYLYLWFFLDAPVERREVVRAACWAFLPVACERLLQAVLLGFHRQQEKLFNPLASNAAFFLDPTTTPIFWYEAARGVSVFTLWTLAIVPLGLAELSGKPARLFLPPLVLAWIALLLIKAWMLS